jgi:hypothetical protein
MYTGRRMIAVVTKITFRRQLGYAVALFSELCMTIARHVDNVDHGNGIIRAFMITDLATDTQIGIDVDDITDSGPANRTGRAAD